MTLLIRSALVACGLTHGVVALGSGSFNQPLIVFLGESATEGSARTVAGDIYQAERASSGSALGYSSCAEEVVSGISAHISVTGTQAMNIACFSDDGCDVWVTDLTSGGSSTQVLAKSNEAQALSNTGDAFHVLGGGTPYAFEPSHTYRIDLTYRNKIYTGSTDVDGVVLIAFGGNAVKFKPTEFVDDPYDAEIPLTAQMGEAILTPSVKNVGRAVDRTFSFAQQPNPNDDFIELDSSSGELRVSKSLIKLNPWGDLVPSTDSYSMQLKVTDVTPDGSVPPQTDVADVTVRISPKSIVGLVGDSVGVESPIDTIQLTVVRVGLGASTNDLHVGGVLKFEGMSGSLPPCEPGDIDVGYHGWSVTIPAGQDRADLHVWTPVPDLWENEPVEQFLVKLQSPPELITDGTAPVPTNLGFDHQTMLAEIEGRILERMGLFGGENNDQSLEDGSPLGIDENDVDQGGISDCYLLVAAILAARHRPDKLQECMELNQATGTYTVRLLRPKNLQTGAYKYEYTTNGSFLDRGASQAQLTGDYDLFGAVEVWPQLFEWGYAQSEDDGYGGIAAGGQGGAQIWKFYFDLDANYLGQFQNMTAAQIGAAIRTEIDAGYAVSVGSLPSPGDPVANGVEFQDDGDKRMASNHEYVVDGFGTTQSAMVPCLILTNPHGPNRRVYVPLTSLDQIVDTYSRYSK
ncbi:hypothetical protein [Stratiformator vulcanicus]|uniref:Calpain catalytic domain-containing protein n=1 Tax=Stratiformator vulcanicus TaxID=2527980 RepID=A0A517QYN4_9PLAN|nr:hypothetical protein [Stratiformator vulcanicus]QDT36714.1 hypothetical protein Pan189_10770 [Stratiformator vulcanicus]